MKTIVRGAIGPALVVAVLQCMMLPVFAIVTFGRPVKQILSMGYINVALSQVVLLIGAATYAGLLRRRSRASLSACTVGGAAVGLLANLSSHVAISVFACLGLAFMINGVVWAGVLVPMFLSCLCAGIGGLIVGEVGGGAVGLLYRRR